ncbi:hypothetical protein [Rhizobium glycinendophyticum]|uniref:Uncharacterized protein n=1 Tax=Rhizobium glycinendophyticum TaxID=2589807 RepID=A0A504UEV0_9HYPH|nr:hypothetical protein [Rhizobium glycinendophyticum]TPP11600.1 hypothetical protein FJQ55_12605 [Rhizobium glycinendophyticum]
MSLSVDTLLASPHLHAAIRAQSAALLAVHEEAPRLASVFGTQQRWLLGHLAMALYFKEVASGASVPAIFLARFFEQVRQFEISSVNTADAFMKEMLVYGMAVQTNSDDKRNRPVAPSPPTIAGVYRWTWIHLRSLDAIDDGNRLSTFEQDESLLARLHPSITARFMVSPAIRTPPQTWSLFTWLNNGGIVMDWLLAGIDPADPSVERVRTQVRSVPQMAEYFRLSRTHLNRKLREAEALGSIGWEGARGRSVMWVSRQFREEYASSQAAKLAIIDEACEEIGLR